MVSILVQLEVIVIEVDKRYRWLKFEFTDDRDLPESVFSVRRTHTYRPIDRHTDAAHILHVYWGSLRLTPITAVGI